jgi:UDP-glucose 4-epimerase
MSRIVLTGPTGRIGRLLGPRLDDAGHQVTRYDRAGPLGDLAVATEDTLARALEGSEVVMHLAGVAHRKADRALIDAVNRDATIRLARVAHQVGVRRFVLASTIYAASMPCRTSRFTALTDDAPHGVYGAAKRAAEAGLQDRFGNDAVILRFAPVLLGPPAGGLGRLLHLSALPIPLPFASLRNRRSLASPETALSALERCVTCGSGVTPVADDTAVSAAEIVTAFRASRGREPGLFALPPALVRAAVHGLAGADVAATLCDDFIVDTGALKAMGIDPVADSMPALRAYAS